MRIMWAMSCVALVAVCASQPKPLPAAESAPQPAAPAGVRSSGSPFAGVTLGNAREGGVVVLGMVAGPAAIAGLLPGDRILRIGDVEVDAPRAQAMILESSPGARLRLQVMRGTTPLEIELIVDERSRWATPAAYPAAVPYAATGLSEAGEFPDPAIEQAVAAAPETAAINQRLDRMFAELARDDAGYNKLPLIREALMRPGAMHAWRDKFVARIRPPAEGRAPIVGLLCETLALTCPPPSADPPPGPVSLSEFAAQIAAANRSVREVFRDAGVDRAQATADLQYLLEKTAADRTLFNQPGVLSGVRAMQLSMRVDLARLAAVAERLLANAQRLPALTGTPHKPPPALAAVVEGDIIDYVEVDGGYVVIGGPGPNRYDMDHLYAVIDVGGDDTYRWGDGVPLETQTVIDLAGDDRYEASRGGPGAGWLGVSLLIDRAGNDQYESRLGGCGAGVLGFGFLFDDAGADRYHCAAWSVGAGIYGAGVLVDKGAESDVYLSEVFSQGVGGPRGVGVLLDAGGSDLYRANGPVASAYGVPASYMAFSQGVGVGIRPYDFGGVGVLIDLGGDDRYEGGEFSQGGGYYWGLGLLVDESGNDLYYGNRYSQGFAAHQAFGMLADLAGDDVYWSMAAAGQAAAWDQSIAMLLDGGGNDVYRAQSLSQGAAAQQSRASLHDLGGDDVYWSSDNVAQGAAGDNSYHFQTDDPVYSLGVLVDERGADRYSTGLRNGEVRMRLNTEDLKKGNGIAGVAVDRE